MEGGAVCRSQLATLSDTDQSWLLGSARLCTAFKDDADSSGLIGIAAALLRGRGKVSAVARQQPQSCAGYNIG